MKKSLLTAYGKSKFLHKPFYAHFYVTRRCNLQCPMCAVPAHGNRENELTIEEIRVLAENMQEIGLGTVVLTGGEPFMRPELNEIISAFSSRGMFVRLQTNGLLADEKNLRECFANGLDFLTVSLDSVQERKFDDFCGHAGLWKAAVAAIRTAVSIKPRGLHVVNTVVTRQNIDELADIATFVDSLGAYASLVPVHTAEHNPIRGDAAYLSLTAADKPRIEKSYRELIRLKKKGLRIGSSLAYLEDARAYLLNRNFRWKCDAGKDYFVIFDDGSISPCDEFPGIPTERGRNAAAVFHSQPFQNHCAEVRRECSGCIWGCWRETSLLLHDHRVTLERIKTYVRNLR
ncbi:MAG: radical SAM protein [Endomicrobiales bacterium]|jgi:MoaA/NifB/PqqE/SkfB family radical SAM enzyme